MGTIEVIKKFIESNWVIERAVREVLERLPLRFSISYGPTFKYWLGFLRESERWDRLEAYQFEQLKDLLIHAGKYVPYYKKLFVDYGFKPEKVQCLEDIKTSPCLTKEMVRDRVNDFVATKIPEEDLIKTTTSSSTGIPLVIYNTRESIEKYHAYIYIIYTAESTIVLKRR